MYGDSTGSEVASIYSTSFILPWLSGNAILKHSLAIIEKSPVHGVKKNGLSSNNHPFQMGWQCKEVIEERFGNYEACFLHDKDTPMGTLKGF